MTNQGGHSGGRQERNARRRSGERISESPAPEVPAGSAGALSAEATSASSARAVSARYGKNYRPLDNARSSFSGKAATLLLLLFIASGILLVVVFMGKLEAPSVSAQVSTIERTADRRLHVELEVSRKDPTTPASCIVRALNFDMLEVGRREVFIPADGAAALSIPTDITTNDLPVSAKVYGCTDHNPAYLTGKPASTVG